MEWLLKRIGRLFGSSGFGEIISPFVSTGYDNLHRCVDPKRETLDELVEE